MRPFALSLHDLEEGENVLGRHVVGDGVGGRDDIAAALPEDAHEAARFALDFLRRREGKEALGADAAVEGDVGAVAALHELDVVHLGLEGVVDSEAQVDEVVEDLVDIAAGMLGDRHALGRDVGVHAFERGLDEAPPVPGPHDQAALLAPIVAEENAVDRILGHEVDDGEIVIGDSPEQLVHEVGIDEKIDEKFGHAPQGPGPFEQGKTNYVHRVLAIAPRDEALAFGADRDGIGHGKPVGAEVGLLERVVFDDPEIALVFTPPDDVVHVAHQSAADRRDDLVPLLGQGVAEPALEIGIAEMGGQAGVNLVRQIELPRHNVTLSLGERIEHEFTRVHRPSSSPSSIQWRGLLRDPP